MVIQFSFWLRFVGVVALPFVLVNGSYALLAQLVPGVVKVSSWEKASSFVFAANIALVIWALWRMQLNLFLRFSLGTFALLLMLYSAFFMQVHWNCGEPIAKFVGETPASEAMQIASCN